MNIHDMIQSGARLKIEMTGEDLCQFAEELIQKTLEAERQKKEEEAPKQEIYLTSKETCKICNVCNTTLWAWAKAGYLVPYKVGKQKRYALSDINRIMNERRGYVAGNATYDVNGNFSLGAHVASQAASQVINNE